MLLGHSLLLSTLTCYALGANRHKDKCTKPLASGQPKEQAVCIPYSGVKAVLVRAL